RFTFNFQTQPDIAFHREVGKKPCLLDHIANRTAQFDDFLLEDRAPPHQNIPAAYAVHAVDRPQQRCLAGSALPQQRHSGAFCHPQPHIVEQRAAIRQAVAHVAKLDGWRRTHALLQKRKAGTRPGLNPYTIIGKRYSSPSSSPSVSSPSASGGTGALIALSGVGAG